MPRYYVRIDRVSDDDLAFLGYTLVAEDSDFKLYRGYTGDEYIVDKAAPWLCVDDVNDAQIIASRSGDPKIVQAPSS